MDIKFLSFSDFGKSKEQLQQERDAYEKMIFPLGPQHKGKIEALLAEIDGRKLNKIDLMISFIDGKQRYLQNHDADNVYRMTLKKDSRLKKDQIRSLVALIVLDSQCEDIDKLPNMTQIKDLASSAGFLA